MNKKVKIIALLIASMLLIVMACNKIFAETTNLSPADNAKTVNTEENEEEVKYIKNIGKPYEGTDYIVGNVDNDEQGNIEINDATELLSFIAYILAWDYENDKVNDDYDIYQKLVEKKIVKNNEKIKNVEDLYNICDVNEDNVISVKDAAEILRYYACKGAGLIKD
ncbi:MAG: hypothetical protein J6K42_04135 [Clostridia bacterium]|nr:hypothetical protein [Clostridia bacterium]